MCPSGPPLPTPGTNWSCIGFNYWPYLYFEFFQCSFEAYDETYPDGDAAHGSHGSHPERPHAGNGLRRAARQPTVLAAGGAPPSGAGPTSDAGVAMPLLCPHPAQFDGRRWHGTRRHVGPVSSRPPLNATAGSLPAAQSPVRRPQVGAPGESLQHLCERPSRALCTRHPLPFLPEGV